MARIGVGIEGSKGETTNATSNILEGFNNTYYKFQLWVMEDCDIVINGEFRVPLFVGEEFVVDENDLKVNSVVIEANPVRYVWKGFY